MIHLVFKFGTSEKKIEEGITFLSKMYAFQLMENLNFKVENLVKLQ